MPLSDMVVPDTSGAERLPLDAYKRDFRRRQWEIGGRDSWKLERQQHFMEPGFPSWDAFAEGDWERSLRLIEEERDFLVDFMRKAAEHRIGLYRLRVVEEPITPYLQWELHLLRLRADCGERIRVVGADTVRELEEDGPLPELLTLGDGVLYTILYTDSGVLDGAQRCMDPQTVSQARELTMRLYESGEELPSYFDRAVSTLPAPETADGHERRGSAERTR
jgi:hypothetical protein